MLHTDASELGLGAVLYQEQDKEKRVISYASQTLSNSERNYLAHKLEFLALKWAITNHFHEYLYRGDFDVYVMSAAPWGRRSHPLVMHFQRCR